MNGGNETEPDMLATPISQLPPPMLQDKKMHAIDNSAPSYDAIRDELFKTNDSPTSHQSAAFGPPMPIVQQQKPQMPVVPNNSTPQHMFQQQPAPPQQQQFMPMYPSAEYPSYQMPLSRPPATSAPDIAGPNKKQERLSPTALLQSKKLWVLSILIFTLIYYGIPRLKRAVPALVSAADGRLTLPGLAVVSVASAAAFTLASETVLA
jgi:hypothetical protein